MTATLPVPLPATAAPSSAPALPLASKYWLDVVTHLDPRYGGLSTVVPQLCSAIAAAGPSSVRLAAFCNPDEISHPAGHPELPVTTWPTSRLAWLRSREFSRSFREQTRGARGVHIHGLWEQSTTIAARTARALGKPYLISAHGMLEPWALRNKRLKKQVYASLFERANLNGAACLHALTEAEAEDYRRFGARSPIAVIPNGVDIPATLDPEPFLAQFPDLRGKRLLLFLGRIHYKKGLDILIEAWGRLAKDWPGTHLVLAGPDSEGTQARVEQGIAQHGLVPQVTFTGMLREQMKWSALAAAECFLLPSYSEGLSTAVLEAMGAGVPVIVTRQCHVPDVKNYETGWEIESNAEALAFSIQSLLTQPAERSRAMGDRGKTLIHTQYGWSSVASRMSEVYEWIAGGPRPRSLELIVNNS